MKTEVLRNKYGQALCQQHNRPQYVCRECGGFGICVHGVRKETCAKCGGSQVCEHKRRRRTCRDCKGTGICEHNHVKYTCRYCKGSQICEHMIQRSRCKQCGGFKAWAKELVRAARKRAQKDNLPYELTVEWAVEKLEQGCPIFNRSFEIHNTVNGPWSASIDKFKPELGYTKENSFIISSLANRIKNNASSEQVMKVAEWMMGVENERLSLPQFRPH